jgi:esterase/lipase superfamily enzyme
MADVEIFFATNRDYLTGGKAPYFGSRFNPDGVAGLRFGRAKFSDAPSGRKLQTVSVYPEKKTATGFTGVGSGSFLDDLRQRMQGERSDTLIFIHGFNVAFPGALAAGARLANEVRVGDRPLNVVVFSWPSDGAAVPLMSYYSDREDARASGPALARAFLKLRDFVEKLAEEDRCQRCLHLLTHSMGGYVLRHGLQAVRAKDPRSLVRLFDQIILAAPDEDDDAFETDDKLRLLPRIGRQVTVYFNPNDRGLLISDKTKANPDRLGSDGPRLVDLLPKKVVLVDCRNIARGADRMAQHSYYIGSPAVSRDISAVLTADDSLIGNRVYIPEERAYRIIKEL